jgi:chemotaxis protein MotB
VQDRFDNKRKQREREIVKTMTFLASVVMSSALLIGCVDRTEQQLRQVQNDLEQVLRTELLNGDIRMQRVSDHLTVTLADRLLFDVGSHEMKPDGIEVLKHMGTLFKTTPLKEIRVTGHADGASVSDRSDQYVGTLAFSRASATQTVRVLKENGADSQKFIIEWYGDIRPIASNETEEGRQMNRRVEIVLFAGIWPDTLMSELPR